MNMPISWNFLTFTVFNLFISVLNLMTRQFDRTSLVDVSHHFTILLTIENTLHVTLCLLPADKPGIVWVDAGDRTLDFGGKLDAIQCR